MQGKDDVFAATDTLLPSPSDFSDEVKEISDGNNDGFISRAGTIHLLLYFYWPRYKSPDFWVAITTYLTHGINF